MGHLRTVQNVIRFLGGAPSLERDDYPVHSPFHAFDSQLEPLTKLARALHRGRESGGVGIVAPQSRATRANP